MLRELGAGGSNPLTPTNETAIEPALRGRLFRAIVGHPKERKRHVDRFRDPGRSPGHPQARASVGAGRVHPGREGARPQAAERGARAAAQEGARPGPVVPVHPQGIWRHGPGPAGQRAGADGAGRERPGRAVDEHAGPGRRLDDDPAGVWQRVSEGEVSQADPQRRETRVLLDDREGRRRRRHRHAHHGGQGRQRQLRSQRREVVLLFGQRRRYRLRDRPH